MAPRLPLSKLEMIENMILSKSPTASQIGQAAECSKRLIINILAVLDTAYILRR
jgi:hypothetical protein